MKHRMIALASTLLALAPLSYASSPSPNTGTASVSSQGARRLEVYELGSLFPTYDGRAWSMSLAAAPTAPGKEESHELATPSGSVFVELLTQFLGDELRREGNEIRLEGEDRLVVLGPAEVHQRVRWLRDAVAQAARAETELRIDAFVLRGAAIEEPTGNVLDEQAAVNLVANLKARGAEQRTHRARLVPGRTETLSLLTRHAFVWDYDVEIAQASLNFDPVVMEAEAGLRLSLRAVPAKDGTYLAVALRSSFLPHGVQQDVLHAAGFVAREEEGQPAMVRGPATVERVMVEQGGLAFDAFLEEGRALVATMRYGEGEEALQQVLLFRKQGGEARPLWLFENGPGGRGLVAANAELLRPSALRVRHAETEIDNEEPHPVVAVSFLNDLPQFLFDWVQRRFPVWRRAGPWAFALVDANAAGSLEELQGFFASMGGEREMHGLSVSVEGSVGTPLSITLPVLADTKCGMLVGRTTTTLVDYDVEVAQQSTVNDPIFAPLFEGLALEVSAVRSGGAEDGVALELDGRLRQARGERRFEGGTDYLGHIDLRAVTDLRLLERVTFDRSQGVPVRATLGDTDVSVVLQLR